MVLFCGAIGGANQALACATSVWPAATTQYSTATINLPTFTGSSPLPDEVTLGPGDYHYSATTISGRGGIDATGETVRIYINGDFTLDGGFPNYSIGRLLFEKRLILVVDGDLTIEQDTRGGAFIYVTGNVTINHRQFDLDGAITAEGYINIIDGDLDDEHAKASGLDMGTLCDDPDVLDSFTITVPSTASACGSATVTVKAVGTGSDPMTDYTGSITLSTSSGHGTWSTSGSGSFNDATADDGAATYTFVSGDNGEVTFTLTNRHADETTVTITDSSEGVSDTSSDIEFQYNGIEINDVSGENWDVIAGRDHTFQVEYTVMNQSSTECQTADYDGSVSLNFWRTLGANNPSGATAPTISNGSNTYSLSASSGSPTALTLTITNGVGSFTLGSTDVGDFQLNVSDSSSGFLVDSGGSPLTLTGYQSRGSNITVRPFGILVEANRSSGTHAATAAGDAYVKAGENFTLQVTGVRYQSGDDANSDGLPDGHDDADPATGADLSDNNVTASFGEESESFTVSAILQLPSGGNSGTLGGSLGSFSSGTGSGTFNYDEVGIIELSAQSDSSYINSGVQLVGKSGYVGRFTPDYFDVTSVAPGLTDGWLDSNADLSNDWTCGFTYFGQSFGFDSDPVLVFTARNAAGNVTQNYQGNFNKYTGATGSLIDNGLPGGYGSSLTAPTPSISVDDDEGDGSDDPGVFAMTLTGFTAVPLPMSYSKPDAVTVEVPFAADFQLQFSAANLTDSDGVCYEPTIGCASYTSGNITGTTLKYGRVAIANSYGSGSSDLPLTYTVENWETGGLFMANLDDNDSCVGSEAPTATLSNYTNELDAGETSATVSSVVVGSGEVTLSAPGVDNIGQVDVQLTLPDYLMYDYDGDGLIETWNSDDRPTATATFGVYGNSSGNEFFRREISR